MVTLGVRLQNKSGSLGVLVGFEGAFFVSREAEGGVAHVDPLVAAELDGSAGALGGDVGFQGGDDHDHGDESLADGRGSVELLLQAYQLDVVLLKQREKVEEVAGGSGEAVEGRDHDSLDLWASELSFETSEGGTVLLRSPGAVATGVFVDFRYPLAAFHFLGADRALAGWGLLVGLGADHGFADVD